MFFSQSTGGFYLRAIHGDAIPPDAVEITDAEHAALLDGQCDGLQIVADESGRPVLASRPSPTVADLREQLAADINTWRDEQENSPILFDHAGREWDGGLVVRTRLQPVVAMVAVPEGFYWTDAANEDVPMDINAVRDLNAAHEAAIVARGWAIHARQRQMKAEVAELQTAEALQGYVVGWPDEVEA